MKKTIIEFDLFILDLKSNRNSFSKYIKKFETNIPKGSNNPFSFKKIKLKKLFVYCIIDIF